MAIEIRKEDIKEASAMFAMINVYNKMASYYELLGNLSTEVEDYLREEYDKLVMKIEAEDLKYFDLCIKDYKAEMIAKIDNTFAGPRLIK